MVTNFATSSSSRARALAPAAANVERPESFRAGPAARTCEATGAPRPGKHGAVGGSMPVACWGQAGEDYVFRGSGRLGEDVDELVPGGGHEHVVADEVAGRADSEYWGLGEVERGSRERCRDPERCACSSPGWMAHRQQSVCEQCRAGLAGPELVPGDADGSAVCYRDRRYEGLLIKRRVGRGVDVDVGREAPGPPA